MHDHSCQNNELLRRGADADSLPSELSFFHGNADVVVDKSEDIYLDERVGMLSTRSKTKTGTKTPTPVKPGPSATRPTLSSQQKEKSPIASTKTHPTPTTSTQSKVVTPTIPPRKKVSTTPKTQTTTKSTNTPPRETNEFELRRSRRQHLAEPEYDFNALEKLKKEKSKKN